MRILGKYFGIIWLLVSALVYASVLISPLHFQYASIVSFAIPIMMLLSILLFLLTTFLRKRFWYYYLFAALLAWPYYSLIYEFKDEPMMGESDFSVLNFNVKWFIGARENNYEDVIDWVIAQDADFLCFQEYYPQRGISKRIMEKGKYYDATDKERFNVALFSKYPIVSKGLLFGQDKLNNALYADVKIKDDTIRIYSVHLESMGINPEKLQDSEGIRSEYDNVKFRILRGSRARAEQVKVIMEHVEDSPYPVLIAGDFNDVPFSYNYFKLKEGLNNAFEEGGRGFGITYNGKIPFLRIDNQFFGEGIEILQFQTLSDVYYSDHFPLMGDYRITD